MYVFPLNTFQLLKDFRKMGAMNSTQSTPHYELLDSGDARKLERFGEKVLVRPSTLCLWKPRLPRSAWDQADAFYEHERGWKFRAQKFESWNCACGEVKFKLRTQDNGQVGLFPEHASYMPRLAQAVRAISAKRAAPARVLNLFAFTGMASIVAAKAGAQVTHVDLSKKALDWASENIALNDLPADALRFIKEDAGDFVERELRREKKYDIIIADPPSFSRISGKKTWQLSEIIQPMLEQYVRLLEAHDAALFFTCHHTEMSPPIVGNILLDLTHPRRTSLEFSHLSIPEKDSGRTLPAGWLVLAQFE